ncbi:protein EPIDERMAL PATTERNING FACTOR 2-like [Carica papaya]|uniref:protein EPIDERMAL PATTERNING FACTOR 2-like n=1 Tax=Carica papaya TaxID=3649 RepID=UPI000B8D023F|nr:protein EPIDERMAL PATTERNING FACTOR 2-like [Carica papaya]
MNKYYGFSIMVILFALVHDILPASASPNHFRVQEQGAGYQPRKHNQVEVLGMDLYPTGSSLPDCSHACGPCFPCKRVMVSFKCSTESCPIVYRCMCKGKYYHVPSN